jgi:diguanylate cyclase
MSLGIAQFQPGDNAASLIERSDACLYEAKRNGRNRVITECHRIAAPQAQAG